jgi:hypothetical protein
VVIKIAKVSVFSSPGRVACASLLLGAFVTRFDPLDQIVSAQKAR